MTLTPMQDWSSIGQPGCTKANSAIGRDGFEQTFGEFLPNQGIVGDGRVFPRNRPVPEAGAAPPPPASRRSSELFRQEFFVESFLEAASPIIDITKLASVVGVEESDTKYLSVSKAARDLSPSITGGIYQPQ